ncbi:MAG: hypothetical protein RSA22_08815 [Acinetobacter sp.]
MEIRVYVNRSTIINHPWNVHVSSIDELEAILGQKVILLKHPRPELGLGGLVNVFRTAQQLGIHVDVEERVADPMCFIINLHESPIKTLYNLYKGKYFSSVKPEKCFSFLSEEDYKNILHFFFEVLSEAGWPSKTGNSSGSGRYNNA